MGVWKTEKETLTPDDILDFITDYEIAYEKRYSKLWQYYKAENETILKRKSPDPNNPDNRTPVPYGRKIVTTFTGYAYRPRYITYKSDNEQYMTQLQTTFNENNEHIKTSRAGRNTGIFGLSYELMYIDGVNTASPVMPTKAEPRFFSVDPREVILLYDYSPEPKKRIGIRYYEISGTLYKVEVYYRDRVETYDRIATDQARSDLKRWRLEATGAYPNYYREVPIVPYYFGDDMLGIIQPVLPLIDDYDLLISDSFNEFDRFAHAYLLLKRMSLVPPELKKEAGAWSAALALLKRRRVFENLNENADVSFLLKDIPKDFIEFMTNLIREQIHIQSHVPDFTSEKLGGNVSGVAVQRLMFDFENVVSSAEADFDTGLIERIRLINVIYGATGMVVDDPGTVTISHKRNLPLDMKEYAGAALTMKQAGFSNYLVADVMPDDIIPDVEEELARQKEETAAMFPSIEQMQPDEDEEENA